MMAVVLVAGLQATSAWAEAPVIGSVKTTSGDARIVRSQGAAPALIGMHLYAQDTLVTGAGGSLGLILRDDSLVSLGPNSELNLVQFQFDPAAQQLSLLTRITQGTVAYFSGQMSKLSPSAVQVETPTATLGVRGTYFVVEVE
jgi:hypothetical protein